MGSSRSEDLGSAASQRDNLTLLLSVSVLLIAGWAPHGDTAGVTSSPLPSGN